MGSRLLLRDEADPAARLEDRPFDVIDRGDLLRACLLGELLGADPLATEVLLDQLPVLHDHDRVAVENAARPAEPERDPRRQDLQPRDRPDRDDRAGYRVVVLGETLLNRVAE